MHQTNVVYIKDEKYGIDGYYYADSCWDSIKKNKSIYFGAIGGAGALMSKCIVSSEVIAYDDLGAEAIRKLEVKVISIYIYNNY